MGDSIQEINALLPVILWERKQPYNAGLTIGDITQMVYKRAGVEIPSEYQLPKAS